MTFSEDDLDRSAGGLLAVVRLTPEDAKAAIELLEHEQANQAVRDRELAERDQLFARARSSSPWPSGPPIAMRSWRDCPTRREPRRQRALLI